MHHAVRNLLNTLTLPILGNRFRQKSHRMSAKGEPTLTPKKPANRRSFLKNTGHLCAAAIAGSAMTLAARATEPEGGQKFLLVGLVGSENPTRANFPFVWARALKEAGNDVRIELAGDATVLMRTAVSNSVTPVGWPPFKDALAKVIELKIPIFV